MFSKGYIPLLFLFVCLRNLSAQDSLSVSTADSSLFSELDMEELIVTGQFLPIGQAQSLNPIEVIDRATIEKRGVMHLDELLQQTLSIRFTQDAVLGGQIQMQGLGGNYVKILVDGVPVVGRNDGNIDLGRIALQNVERVEIIEGPMSVAYGTNAMGGVINIITKRHQQAELEGQLSATAESVGRANGAATLGGKWKKLTWRGHYNYYGFNGFSTDTLRALPWNPKTQHNVEALLRYDFSPDFHLKYNFRYLDEFIDNRGNLRLANFPELAYASDNEFLTLSQDHNLSWAAYLGQERQYYAEGFLAFNDFRREKNAYYRPLLDNETPLFLDTLNSDTTIFRAWHLHATLASAYNKKFDFQAGLDLRYEQGLGARIAAANEGNPFADIGDYAIFANLRYRPIAKLQSQLGLRYAYNSRYRSPLTFNVLVKWDMFKNLSLRASYTRGFRSPELKELFLDFVDSNHFIKGNPNLRAEYSHHARLSLHYDKEWDKKQSFSLAWGGFYNQIKDQIALQEFVTDSSGQFVIAEQATNQFAYFNIGRFSTLGSDLRLEYRYRHLLLRLGAILIGRFNPISNDFADVPPFSYTLEFNQEISYEWPKYGITVALFRKDYDKLIRFARIYDPIKQEEKVLQRELGGYALMDFSIAKTFFNKDLRLAFGVRNLLNINNVALSGAAGGVHGGGGSQLPTAMGRSYFVQLSYQFNYTAKK